MAELARPFFVGSHRASYSGQKSISERGLPMASLWSRLFKRGEKKQIRKRVSRRLRVESLENRRLMAVDIATISGVAFTDANDDGLLTGDVRISGATIRLYRDGGDGLFDAGVGDDVLVDTDTTDVNGAYEFTELGAGTYFVQQQAVTGLVQRPSQTVQTVVISALQAAGTPVQLIDSFDTPPGGQEVLAAIPTPTIDSSSEAAGDAIGGERDLYAEITSGTGSLSLQANSIVPGALSAGATGGGNGTRRITWDGLDGDATTLNPTGLGGIDITGAGTATGFRFLIGSDQANSQVVIRVYTDAGNWATSTTLIPDTGGAASEDVFVSFASFTIGAGLVDFTNVGAIEMELGGALPDVDFQLNILETVGPTVITRNFANLPPLSLGDLVWNDLDGDGVKDVTEAGISGVTVQLYNDVDANGAYTDGVDTLVTTTTTNGTGNYLFTNLLPGEYIALIPIAQFNTGQPLFGFLSSAGNDPAPDPDNNVNDDDNGTLIAGIGVASAAITLTLQGEPIDDGDTDANTNLTLDFGFTPSLDLVITKSEDVDPVIAGNQLTYTLTVANNGPASATNTVVSDTLPAGMSFVSATSSQGSVTQNAGVVTGNLGTIANGANATITVVVLIDSTFVGPTISNTATVTADGLDTNTANNTSTADTTVNTSTDLAITKTDAPDPVSPNGTLTYTLTVTNNGPSQATGVTVTDVLPGDVTFVSATPSQGTANNNAGTVTSTLGTIASGGQATITVVVSVNPSAGTTVTNTATVDGNENDPVAGNNTATTTTTVSPEIDLAITKTDSPDPVIAGQNLTYTITVTNNGPSNATGVTITDTLPTGVTFVSATPTQGTASEASGVVTANIGSLASGQAVTMTIIVGVPATATGTLNNTATTTANETDTNTTNNSASASTTINRNIDLVITKTDTPDPVVAGQVLTYTLTVTNNGPSSATDVVVNDTLPTGLTVTNVTTSQGTSSTTGQAVSAAIGTLANGASATVTITATVAATQRTALTNTATVTGLETDTNTANNTATATTTVNASVDLSITKTDSPDAVIAGNQLTYTILVTNTGPSTATGVIVSDVLPTGVTFVSGTSTVGTVTNNAGTVSGNIGTLAPNASATITLIVGVNGTTRGTLNNTATVTSTETDSNTANNSATATTTVNTQFDLAITKVDNVDPITPSTTLTYTITVTNTGPTTARGVTVNDTLPTGLTFLSATSTVGTVTNTGNAVTGTLGDLASGATATITINATIAPTFLGTLTNTATVTTTDTETNTANNTATQTTTVTNFSSIIGQVFVDSNRNGIRDAGEVGIPGVVIELTGNDISPAVAGQNLGGITPQAAVSRTTTTDANGQYRFDNLLPGTYTVRQLALPPGFNDGPDFQGSLGGTAGNNQVTTINLGAGQTGTAYNFTAFIPLSKRQFLASS